MFNDIKAVSVSQSNHKHIQVYKISNCQYNFTHHSSYMTYKKNLIVKTLFTINSLNLFYPLTVVKRPVLIFLVISVTT